ncbi:hypothetical protein SISNIDRAFT_484976 [Sistotremastrum niveocremeum HHB9708]|uniref:Mixed lineage kinase domain-containing protein n=1 Tax=Sistotremastrum niveocremeum HHB9708 TaxID=1314777 RepID=A0A164VC98_9AGAM|nr:hypothetical protein SISNIDRAFT_484976 [Sistotremastrum niveocremeum HHB9708]
MPLQSDTTSNLLKGLKILQSLGEAIPAGGIVKSVAGVGIIVLETAEMQKVHVNKQECSGIAERAAKHIIMLHSTFNADGPLSDDLRERLESYLEVLEDVFETVKRLGSESRLRRTIKATSVQEEVKECLDKLNEAYQSYIAISILDLRRFQAVNARGRDEVSFTGTIFSFFSTN